LYTVIEDPLKGLVWKRGGKNHLKNAVLCGNPFYFSLLDP
jgi:hypothetical protein